MALPAPLIGVRVSDVFLSYNREDQAIAQRFAQGFEREGLSVWWMPTLRSGDTYDSETEKALRQAASVAVVRATIASLRAAPLAEVERDARKALELDPADSDAQGILATLEARRGNWIAAEELFATIGARSRTPEYYQTHVIGTLWPTGQLRKVLEELVEARRLAPAAVAFNINLARAYSSLD